MRKKLAILVTMLVMLLLAASPAFADTAFTQANSPEYIAYLAEGFRILN